jgi:hypothetical protein
MHVFGRLAATSVVPVLLMDMWCFNLDAFDLQKSMWTALLTVGISGRTKVLSTLLEKKGRSCEVLLPLDTH